MAEVLRLEGLPQGLDDAEIAKALQPLVVGLGADHDDLEVGEGRVLADFARELLAVHDRHVDVEEDEVNPRGVEHREGFLAVAGGEDPVVRHAGELGDLLDRPPKDR